MSKHTSDTCDFVDTIDGYAPAEIHAAGVNGGWIVTVPQNVEGFPGQSRMVNIAGPFLSIGEARAWIDDHRHA